jgi:hypothetical protein
MLVKHHGDTQEFIDHIRSSVCRIPIPESIMTDVETALAAADKYVREAFDVFAEEVKRRFVESLEWTEKIYNESLSQRRYVAVMKDHLSGLLANMNALSSSIESSVSLTSECRSNTAHALAHLTNANRDLVPHRALRQSCENALLGYQSEVAKVATGLHAFEVPTFEGLLSRGCAKIQCAATISPTKRERGCEALSSLESDAKRKNKKALGNRTNMIK